MTLDDFAGFEKELHSELDKLDRHHDEDRRYVKQFATKQDGRLAASSLAKYLQSLRLTARRMDRPLSTMGELEFDEHIYDLRNSAEYGFGGNQGVSDSTAQNVQAAVRKFLQWVHRDDDDHWSHDYDTVRINDADTLSADEMLQTEHIQALLEAANNLRDVALVEFLADTGVRRTLAGSLRVGDVDLDGPRATFRPNPNATGLKGADIKDYPLIDSAASIRNYLRSVHPRPDRDDVALFHKIPGSGYQPGDDDGALTASSMHDQLQRIADRANIDRPTNPHNFRHSAITRMRREGYTRSEVEHRVCWTVDSSMWDTYEHISAAEHNESIFEQAGVVDEDADTEDTVRKSCGNCHEPIAPYHQYCPRCGAPASAATRDVHEQAQDSLVSDLRTISDDDLRNVVADMLDRVREQPDSLGNHESPPSSD